MADAPRIAAVLTAFNRRDQTLACLRSIGGQADRGDVSLEVFIVDDGSTDGTGEAIAAEFPEVRLLHGDGSLYWNGGMRLAFGAALAEGFDFYWWLNDDTELDDGALSLLLATHAELSTRGSAASIVAGSTRHPETGELTYGGVVRPSQSRPMHFRLLSPRHEPRECETMNGNCVLIPRQVAERVGNIDAAYRQKMGDYDYGLRARRAGCSVWITPGTIGTCADHPPRATDTAPLRDELRRLWSVKELPPGPWATFTRRWGGPAWPVYFASPYLRRAAALVMERLRPLRGAGE